MTKERESYLLAETIFKLTAKYELKEFCEFKMPSRINQEKYIDFDVRLYDPKYVGVTLYHLINIIEIMKATNNQLEYDDIRNEIAGEITKCHYIDLEKVLLHLINNNLKDVFERFLILLDGTLEYVMLDGINTEVEFITSKVYYDLLKESLNSKNRTDNYEELLALPRDNLDTYIEVVNWFIHKSNLGFKDSLDLILDIFSKEGYYTFFQLLRLMMWSKLERMYAEGGKLNIFLKNSILRKVVEIKEDKEEYNYWVQYSEHIEQNNFVNALEDRKLTKDIETIKLKIYENRNAGKNTVL